MRGWAERQMQRWHMQSWVRGDRAPLRLVEAPRQDPSVATGLKSESLIPRRGGWSARKAAGRGGMLAAPGHAAAEGAAPGSEERGAGQDGAPSAGRVRWNLTA